MLPALSGPALPPVKPLLSRPFNAVRDASHSHWLGERPSVIKADDYKPRCPLNPQRHVTEETAEVWFLGANPKVPGRAWRNRQHGGRTVACRGPGNLSGLGPLPPKSSESKGQERARLAS